MSLKCSTEGYTLKGLYNDKHSEVLQYITWAGSGVWNNREERILLYHEETDWSLSLEAPSNFTSAVLLHGTSGLSQQATSCEVVCASRNVEGSPPKSGPYLEIMNLSLICTASCASPLKTFHWLFFPLKPDVLTCFLDQVSLKIPVRMLYSIWPSFWSCLVFTLVLNIVTYVSLYI